MELVKATGQFVQLECVFIHTHTHTHTHTHIYSVIKKDGLNFVSLYFKIRTSDKYDVNYILFYSQ